ncbi:MAG: amino acid decarboxylase [Chitinophagaceae bacterium]|nr:amino acid decarboxylase [Oligoflexus sp.]
MSKLHTSPFDWTAAQIETAFASMAKQTGAWWESLPNLNPAGTAHDPLTHSVKKDWTHPFHEGTPPEKGSALDGLVEGLIRDLGRDSQVVGHPTYLAYVAGAGNPVAAIGQALAMLLNPYTGTFSTAPAAVELEDQTIRWLVTMMGWPSAGTGLLTTGSSLAIFSAVLAAREVRPALPGKRRVYVSDQAHHCIGKALFAAGFLPEETAVIENDEGRLGAEKVRDRIRSDKKKGLVPIMLVGTAGTTNLGRVDPLNDLADICAAEDLWFHVDGAYGGFFRTLPEASILNGLERGDSLSLDPHKAFCMPYGTGALLVKDVKAIRWPRGLDASYMPPFDPGLMRLEYSDISPELSRDFRGLRLWLSIKVFGMETFRSHLASKWQQARWLCAGLEDHAAFEIVAKPDLSLFGWRLKNDPDNSKTKKLFQQINSSGRFFVTTCEWQKKLVIRTCILGFRTDQSHLEEFLQHIVSLAEKG